MKKRLYARTKAQIAFMEKFKRETLFEFQDDRSRSFRAVAEDQLHWYENHSTDARVRLSRALDELTPAGRKAVRHD